MATWGKECLHLPIDPDPQRSHFNQSPRKKPAATRNSFQNSDLFIFTTEWVRSGPRCCFSRRPGSQKPIPKLCRKMGLHAPCWRARQFLYLRRVVDQESKTDIVGRAVSASIGAPRFSALYRRLRARQNRNPVTSRKPGTMPVKATPHCQYRPPTKPPCRGYIVSLTRAPRSCAVASWICSTCAR